MRSRVICASICWVFLACAQDGLRDNDDSSGMDDSFFRCEVQPVLAATCAFMACHGNSERPFSIYAEQRYRLDTPWEDFERPLTEEELSANYRAASGFVSRERGEPDWLSEKPLDTRAGGLFHRGRDLYGDDDVFLSEEDPRYQTLRRFIAGEAADAGCTAGEVEL